jgi:hypothetical protein
MSIWLVSECVTFAVRPARRYDLHSRFWDLYLTQFIPFPYDNNSMAYYKNIINIWTRARTETYPERIKGKTFESMRSYVFVAWFPDLSVAIRICILGCLYNLKANRNQISKYFELWSIYDSQEWLYRTEVEICNMRLFHSPLRLSIFYGSRDQLRPGSFLQKREEPGNEVGIIFNEVETNDLCMTSETQSNIKQSSSIFWLL